MEPFCLLSLILISTITTAIPVDFTYSFSIDSKDTYFNSWIYDLGPPILDKKGRSGKGIKGLFLKGAVILGAMGGTLTAAPIVPSIIGRKKRDNSAFPSARMLNVSYHQLDDSLFDSLPYQGAPVPKSLWKELERYMPPPDAMGDAECIQKSFCENLVQLNHSPFQESLLFFYSAWVTTIKFNLNQEFYTRSNQIIKISIYSKLMEQKSVLFNVLLLNRSLFSLSLSLNRQWERQSSIAKHTNKHDVLDIESLTCSNAKIIFNQMKWYIRLLWT